MTRRALLTTGTFVLILSATSPQLGQAKTLRPAAAELMAAVAAATSTPQSSATESPIHPTLPSRSAVTRPELIALTQPAIVRVLTHFEGTTTIPTFDVNLETLTWSVGTGASEPLPYDTDLLGSGFIISPEGFILTNSHVVSGATLRLELAKQLAAQVVIGRALSLTDAENAKLEALGYSAVQYQKLVTDGVSYVANHLPAMNPASITVLKPNVPLPATTTSAFETQVLSSTDEALQNQISTLIKAGVPADIVSVNDKYEDDEKDVAIIHVKETGLPSIILGSDSSVQTGASIYVFGFPATADIGGFNGEPSITSGAVNALKDSTQHTFKYIQTDAKVSVGSSGGPMIDSSGAAIGVLTLLSAGGSGDSFAFAVPINLTKPILAASAVFASPGDYASHFLAGLALENTRHCKAATVEFNAAATANPVFGSVLTYVQPHIDACAALMASGQSIDSTWDEILNWIEERGVTFWLGLFAGILFVGALIVVIVLLMRRMHRGEVAMQDMSDRRDASHENEVPPSLSAPIVTEELIVTPVAAISETLSAPVLPKNPELVAYIEEARRSGQTSSQIRTALLGAGWDKHTVEENLGSEETSPVGMQESTPAHIGLQNV